MSVPELVKQMRERVDAMRAQTDNPELVAALSDVLATFEAVVPLLLKQTRPSGFNLARYQVDVFSPEVVPAEEGSAYKWDMSDQRLLANLPAMIEAVEENLQDLMPEGYTVSVTPMKESP